MTKERRPGCVVCGHPMLHKKNGAFLSCEGKITIENKEGISFIGSSDKYKVGKMVEGEPSERFLDSLRKLEPHPKYLLSSKFNRSSSPAKIDAKDA